MKLTPIYRVTVFVPDNHLDELAGAIRANSSLSLGDYANLLWHGRGWTESFVPLPGAKPAAGRVGEQTEVTVSALVFSLPRDEAALRDALENTVLPNHPWESPGIYIEESYVPVFDPRS
ncbi:MAG: hypothetical protein MJA83_12570 [Gammaproteobacteria bacterium]|nr:hypothetical protein [Gammaproteobacteria bacterium]